MRYGLIHADVLDGLAQLEPESVQCVVTSPPYWGLRDYGIDGQLGLEKTPDEYVERMVEVFREVWRVLRNDGSLWLNLGDSYCASSVGQTSSRVVSVNTKQATNRGADIFSPHRSGVPDGMKPKDLVGIPWFVAFALRADGWYLRSDIIWSKPNPMPESVTDRPTKAHEYLFLLTKSARYFYDADAIKEASIYAGDLKRTNGNDGMAENVDGNRTRDGFRRGVVVPETRNKRSVWHIPTAPFPEAHFATFPTALVEPCILAGSRVGDTVLDPFSGSGTTGVVALSHQRNYVGIELNPDYVAMSRRRLESVAPMFAKEVTA